MPIVDSLDVSEDDLVLALFEIVGYGRRSRQTGRITNVGRVPSVDAQTHQRHVAVDDLPQIANVVPFRLDQFLRHTKWYQSEIAEKKNKR